MEINETHNEHEHASTSLKVVLLVFAIVLVGALAYLVWAANTAPDVTDYSATKTTTKTDQSAGWKTYTERQYNFSFKYPDNSFAYKSVATGAEYYIQVYKIGGLDTAGPSFRFAKYGETLAVDSNDPPKETMIITDLATLKTYLGKSGYKKIISTTLNGQQALMVDEAAPNDTGYVFGYYVGGPTGYYTLTSSQDSTPEIEKTILASFKIL